MNPSDLKFALAKLSPVAPTRTTLAILSCAKLKTADGLLHIEATNLDQMMRTSVEYDGSDIDCLVNLRKLAALLDSPSGIHLTQKAGALLISGDGWKINLATLPPDEWPITHPPSGNEIVLERDYGPDIEWLSACTSTDVSRYLLQGICFRDKQAIATDGRRLCITEFEADLGGIIVPPNKALAALMRPGGVLRWDDRNIQVTLGDDSFQTRLIEGNYPNTSRLIPTSHDAAIKLNCADAIVAIKRVMPFVHDKHTGIRCVAAEGTLRITTSFEGESAEASVKCDGSLLFTCSPYYLLHVLSGFSGDVEIDLAAPATIHIKSDEREVVMMGMRI